MKKAKLAAGSSGSASASVTTRAPALTVSRKSGFTGKEDLHHAPVDGMSTSSQPKSNPPPVGHGGTGSPSANAAAAFLTTERFASIFVKSAELTDAERLREIKRVSLCLSTLSRSPQQSIHGSGISNILKRLYPHVDRIDDDTWNIFVQAMLCGMVPKYCGSCFTTLEKLVSEVLIHRPNYAISIASMLVTKFVRTSTSITPMVMLDDGPSVVELKCFDVAIKLLYKIVEAVGVKALSRPLLNVFVSNYPYVLKPPLTHFYYIRNLLSLNKMVASSLTYSVLSVVLHKLTHLDSLLPRDILSSDPIQSVVLPKREKSSLPAVDNPYIITEEEAEELVVELVKAYSKASIDVDQTQQIATLDVCVSYLISFLSKVHETINFNSLLTIFESDILPTFNTNCVQFAFFYLINLKDEYSNAFLVFLWKKVSTPNTPMVIKIQAAGYMAGVLARSTKIDRRALLRWMTRLATFAHEYLDSRCASKSSHWSNVNIHAHGAFYAACQAMFYVFAFRHFELVFGHLNLKDEDKQGGDNKPNLTALPPPGPGSFIFSLNLQRLITSDLNPLKACSPTVAKAFVAAAHTYQISYCKTVLERNNRANIRNMVFDNMRDVTNPSDQRAVNLIVESFFPFDPLPLPYCKMIVDEGFRPNDGNSMALSVVGEAYSNSTLASRTRNGDSLCDDLDFDGEDIGDDGGMLLVCE